MTTVNPHVPPSLSPPVPQVQSNAAAAAAAPLEPVTIDLGKQKLKHIKRLRRGEGYLHAEVQDALHELRATGTIGSNVQTVVVVVERKRRKSKKGLLW